MLVGYVRVSSEPDRQNAKLQVAGVDAGICMKTARPVPKMIGGL